MSFAPFRSPLDEAVRLLAYAEVRAMFLAWAGVPWSPVARTRSVVERILADHPPSRVVACAQARLRDETLAALRQRRPNWPDATLGDGQLGGALGLEETVHEAARCAYVNRSGDPRLLPVAVPLADLLRRRCTRPGDDT